MDKKVADKIFNEIEAAAHAIAKKYGVALTPRGSWGADGMTSTLRFKDLVVSESGLTQTKALLTAAAYPWNRVDVNKPFTSRGVEYHLVDYRPKASKFPWVGQDALGNRLCFPDATVKKFCSLEAVLA